MGKSLLRFWNFGLGIQEHGDMDLRYDLHWDLQPGFPCIAVGWVRFQHSRQEVQNKPHWSHRISKGEAVFWSQQKCDGVILPRK